MKRAVSISIGSSKRDKAVVVTLLGEQVSIERLGTDGDMEAAASISPSVPSLSMQTFSPRSVTSTDLSRLDEPMLMLTARFIRTPPA